MDQESFQKSVFGGNIADLVPQLSSHINQIETFFKGKHTFTALEKRHFLVSALDEIESALPSYTSADFDSLIAAATPFKTAYLSEVTISKILKNHPPSTLLQACSNNEQLQKLSPRAILALTRYTEDSSWQEAYHTILADINSGDFCEQLPECVAVDATLITGIFESNGHSMKPWSVSHNKETGVILLFQNNQMNVRTPKLLTLSVFLHYLYEVAYFSAFIAKRKQNIGFGEILVSILKSKKNLFPFLVDGNAHDETLYWRKSYEYLKGMVSADMAEFDDCFQSVLIQNQTTYSLNYIDLLWDINEIYSEKTNLYHLQQEVWLSLEEALSTMSSTEFERYIGESLALNNREFLSAIEIKGETVYSGARQHLQGEKI